MKFIKKKVDDIKTTFGFGAKTKAKMKDIKECDVLEILDKSAVEVSAETELAENITMNINAAIGPEETKVGVKFTKRF